MFTKVESGFSLVEMLVTIWLLSFIAAIGGYGFYKLVPRYRLNGAVQSIVSDFQNARMKAIGQNCFFRIQFFPEQNQYLLERENLSGSSRWPGDQEGILRNFDTPSPYYYPGVALESSSNNPVFSPRGTVIGTTVVLKNPAGSRKITLSSLGRVKVQE